MEERKRILNMLSEGKINSEEAEKLLKALSNDSEKKNNKQNTKIKTKTKNLKGKLRIEVLSEDGDNVNIAIPLKLAGMMKSFMPASAKEELEEEGVDLNAIIDGISESVDEFDEDIVNINSSEGDKVRIYIDRE